MNRLVIIGNGFDMAHGLKTSYKDFINWYWERRLNGISRILWWPSSWGSRIERTTQRVIWNRPSSTT